MPNHKSAEKRVRQSEKRRVINRGNRTKVRTYIKKLRDGARLGQERRVQKVLPETISVIDKAVQKGVMHKNAAARYKSRLTVQANQAAQVELTNNLKTFRGGSTFRSASVFIWRSDQ